MKLSLKNPVKTLAVRETALVPKKGELVVRQPKTIDLAPAGGRELATKKGGGTVVVAGNNQPVSRSEGEAGGAKVDERNDGSRVDQNPVQSKMKGLVRAAHAVEILVRFAKLSESDAEGMVRDYVLSWSNKRKKQALADGKTIARRIGGTGFGGVNNKGFQKGHKRGQQGAGTSDASKAAPGQSSEDFKESVRKRWAKKDAPASPAPAPALGDKTKPLQLGDAPAKAKPLQLGDAPKPKRSHGALGFAADAGSALKAKGVETVQAARENTMQGVIADAAVGGAKQHVAEVRKLWNSGNKMRAVNLATKHYVPGMVIWAETMDWLSKRAGL